MNNVEAVPNQKHTLYKLEKPTTTLYLVAHNADNRAYVIKIQPEQECLTGLTALEKCVDQKTAEELAKTFGWKPVKAKISLLLPRPEISN